MLIRRLVGAAVTRHLARLSMQSVDHMELLKYELLKSLNHAIKSVQPDRLIRDWIQLPNTNKLLIGNDCYELKGPCHVIGFGKAVYGMFLELEKMLGSNIRSGILSVPLGLDTGSSPTRLNGRVKIHHGAKDNLPDEKAELAAKEISSLVAGLGRDDLVIVLISGGGSALLPYPRPPVTLAEKYNVIRLLSLRGADILELNCVRKRLSVLKGGGLAEMAHPARLAALVLSDVIGDPLDFIASGPTVPNRDDPQAPNGILHKYGITAEELPESVRSVLGMPRLSGNDFNQVRNYIIGSNATAAKAALDKASGCRDDQTTVLLSTRVGGNVADVSLAYAELAARTALRIMEGSKRRTSTTGDLVNIRNALGMTDEAVNKIENASNSRRSMCLVAGGETTVRVTGTGKGGRNHELALRFAVGIDRLTATSEIRDKFHIAFMSAGTDGIDGPTDSAGAISYMGTCRDAAAQGLDPQASIDNNDSYGFYETFNGGRDLIKIGHTGTNVMDLHVLVIRRK